jgi:hypothetical protein
LRYYRGKLQDWCSEVYTISEGIILSLLKRFKCLAFFWFNLIVDNQRTLVDTNDFDLGGMNTERCCESIHECCCSSLSEKLGKCPLHSDKSLNSVLWLDLESAVGSDVELKNVLNTDVSILSAEALLDLSIPAV